MVNGRRPALALAAVMALAGQACSSDDRPQAETSAVATAATAQPERPVADGSGVGGLADAGRGEPAPTERPTRPERQVEPSTGEAGVAPVDASTAAPADQGSRLQPAMIRAQDLPEGWEAVEEPEEDRDDRSSGDGEPPTIRICNTTDFGAEFEFESAQDVAGSVFRRAVFGPYVTSLAATLPSGAVEGLLSDLDEAGRSCRTWTQEGDDGTRTVFTIEPLDVELGDQTAAFGLTITRGFLRVEMDLVLWRQGDVGAGVIHAGTTGSVDRGLSRTLADVVARRVAQIVTG